MMKQVFITQCNNTPAQRHLTIPGGRMERNSEEGKSYNPGRGKASLVRNKAQTFQATE